MSKVGKWITGIGVLGLLGYIVYQNIMANQFSYGLVATIVVFFVFILFIYQCGNKEIDKQKYRPIFYILLIVSIIANIFLYTRTSPTPLSDETQDWKIGTLNEWFLPKASQEVEIAGGGWSLFSDTVLSDLLAGRKILVQDILKKDIRATAAVRMGEAKAFAGISKEGIKEYLEKYIPQEMVFTLKDGKTQKLYLVTGTVWEDESNSIYVILDEESDVWMIPDNLLNSAYKMETEFCYQYEGEFTKEDIETLIFQYRFDTVMEKLFAEKESNLMNNIVYMFLLCSFGFLLLLPISNKVASELIVYLSLPTGVLLEIVSCIVIGCVLGFNISKRTMLVGMVIPVMFMWAIWIWKAKEKRLKFNISFDTSLAVGIIVFAIFCASVWHKVFLSYDSVSSIVLAQYIVRDGSFRDYFLGVSNNSLFIPVVDIGAVLFGVKILYSFVPVLCCSFLGMAWVILRKHLRGVTDMQKYIILICSFGAVITVPVFQLNAVWILNNLGIGLFYIGAIMMFLEGKKMNNPHCKYLAVPLFIFASAARVESPIFGAIFLVIWDMVDEEIAKICSVGLGVATTIVFLLNFAFNRDGVVFWSVSKGLMVLVSAWCAVFYLFVMKKWKVWQEIIKKADIKGMIEAGLIIGILAVSLIWKQEKALGNLQALISSMLTTGIYGTIWIIYLFSFLLKFTKERETETVQAIWAIRGIINANFLITFALMLFREIPLRTTYTDSAGRMMLHVLPLVIIYFIYIFRYLAVGEKKELYSEGERI
mgnify:CR=1 FL=1